MNKFNKLKIILMQNRTISIKNYKTNISFIVKHFNTILNITIKC